MSQIILDGEVQPAENTNKTWGEVLDALERRSAEAGRVVTGARFDGVDEPAFRHEEVRLRLLRSLGAIEVESAQPRELLFSTFDEAERGVAVLTSAAERIGAGFRAFDVSSARGELAEFAQTLGTTITLANVLSQAIGVDLGSIDCDGVAAAEMIADLSREVDALVGAQEDGDWITVADIMEYDLAPALARWPAVFAALRVRVDAPSHA